MLHDQNQSMEWALDACWGILIITSARQASPQIENVIELHSRLEQMWHVAFFVVKLESVLSSLSLSG